MRVDELVSIAELFSVSLDTLLSHSVEQADNEAFALRELADAARQTARQAESLSAMLTARISATS